MWVRVNGIRRKISRVSSSFLQLRFGVLLMSENTELREAIERYDRAKADSFNPNGSWSLNSAAHSVVEIARAALSRPVPDDTDARPVFNVGDLVTGSQFSGPKRVVEVGPDWVCVSLTPTETRVFLKRRVAPVVPVTEGVDLEAIEARANAATPGKWTAWDVVSSDEETETVIMGDSVGPAIDSSRVALIQFGHEEGDAQFIAHARQDIPALIAEVRDLRSRLSPPSEALAPMAPEFEDQLTDSEWLEHRRHSPEPFGPNPADALTIRKEQS